MTDREILTKAINKAIDAEWQAIFPTREKWRVGKEGKNYGVFIKLPSGELYFDCLLFMFSKDFAKALWGDKEGDFANPVYFIHKDGDTEYSHTDTYRGPWWKYHLMQMVIADNPIKYLGEHLDD